MFVKTIHLLTKQYVQFQVITPEVEKIVAESGIREGMEIGRASCRERV